MLVNDLLSVDDKPKISWQLFLTLCQRISESSLCLKCPSHYENSTRTKTRSLPHSFQSSIAPKQEHNMGAIRETPRELGFCSPGSPRFHFKFHIRTISIKTSSSAVVRLNPKFWPNDGGIQTYYEASEWLPNKLQLFEVGSPLHV